VFSQLSAAVVRHKANDGVVYAIRAWFRYGTILHCLQWYKLVLRTRYHSSSAASSTRKQSESADSRHVAVHYFYRVVQKNGATLHFPKYLENY